MAVSGLIMALAIRFAWILLAAAPCRRIFGSTRFRTVHYVISRVLMAVIALHIVGALYHTLFLTDGLMRRMFFGRRLVATNDFQPAPAIHWRRGHEFPDARAGLRTIHHLIVFAAGARWYAVPWLNARPRADALTALLWVHVFRYVALQVFSAQHDRLPDLRPWGHRDRDRRRRRRGDGFRGNCAACGEARRSRLCWRGCWRRRRCMTPSPIFTAACASI